MYFGLDAGVGVGDQPAQRLQALALGHARRRISTTAAAASLMPEALPAVTVPLLSNTGLSLAMPSMEASARTCSSVSKATVPLRDLISIGRICSLK